jgi:formylglycine-generating enzyme required for sulfatase activity
MMVAPALKQLRLRCSQRTVFLFFAMHTFVLLLRSASVVMGQAPVGLEIERTAGSEGLRLAFAASTGSVYRVYQSRDLNLWIPQQILVASEAQMSLDITADQTGSAFYRLAGIPVQPLAQMIWISPGKFVMGSPPNEIGHYLDKEQPQTRVTLTRGYWISRYEVTQAEFEKVMGFNPSLFQGDAQRPVEDVTWDSATEYCAALTALEQQNGHLLAAFEYRLPTEAEWEYAARAGTTTRFSYGDDFGYELLPQYAWYSGNSGLWSHPVGQKLPNPWGLYDMHGNVFEWCSDWFGQLPGRWVADPNGPAGGTDRIIRGGYWDSTSAFCRSASRFHFPPQTRISYVGFRVALAEKLGEGLRR